ncbi:M6 family metalloprotease domain-containing protein [Zoogloea sp.]|uniref:M6 family metalloprotease domain-containing protein n=1 Tax=Zoogloea sp. TaxID=49181 RepID=UPI00262C25C7|nr:M6 family metalloprotease domain-containing protein [Zoogloea sp.]
MTTYRYLSLARDMQHIYREARVSEDGERCMVAPCPELADKLKKELTAMRGKAKEFMASFQIRASEPRHDGFNDGMIFPPEDYPLGASPSMIRGAAAERAPLRGVVRVIVVLVDFSDKPMTQTAAHFEQLFFSTGVIPTKSVREYFTDVTRGLVNIQGQVVGPFRMPKTLAQYAHGASGTGSPLPNARTMARDAVLASNASVNFGLYDNDGNGYVDAFIVVHAGAGAEVTGSPGDIWSHKWTVDGGAMNVDGTKIYAYLTVPEDSKIGVCCHELGHLLFGFPDLYDTDYTSEGIGNWCLMAGGSWGGGGNTPVHPSAWCKANQGWATVTNVTTNGAKNIADVKDSGKIYRLWKSGAASSEYFLVENRQKTGFDASLPAGGLLIWHIDDSVSGNTNEAHYKVALMQADGKRDMELDHNRGDGGDPYPGSSGNTTFNNTSTPNSQSYSGANTCVAVTGIGPSGPVISANLRVKCTVTKIKKELAAEKALVNDKTVASEKLVEKKIEKRIEKQVDKQIDKQVEKRVEKPITDKSAGLDKGQTEKFVEGKLADKPGGGLRTEEFGVLEARIAHIEALLLGNQAAQPFISRDLRPDLSGSAYSDEGDDEEADPASGSSKRLLDRPAG